MTKNDGVIGGVGRLRNINGLRLNAQKLNTHTGRATTIAELEKNFVIGLTELFLPKWLAGSILEFFRSAGDGLEPAFFQDQKQRLFHAA